MELEDFFALVHPAIAVIVVFPLIGIVVNRAWLVRQRRLQVIDGEKSKIPSVAESKINAKPLTEDNDILK